MGEGSPLALSSPKGRDPLMALDSGLRGNDDFRAWERGGCPDIKAKLHWLIDAMPGKLLGIALLSGVTLWQAPLEFYALAPNFAWF
ncbi:MULTISPECIES: hypothetical protein [unclassified Endozoicomonas]|uniref:hypothetical protein n=1 Tax=unclassified Endozoicomonas TaxID=2644528 RepID=UPI002148FE72|nr:MULTISPECIES: hypothetical protein [unclassified Endozoicomonas]